MCSSLSDNFWMDRSEWRHWNSSDFSCLPYLIYHPWFSSFLFYIPLFLIISFLFYLFPFSPIFGKSSTGLVSSTRVVLVSRTMQREVHRKILLMETWLSPTKEIFFFPGIVKPSAGVTDVLPRERSFCFCKLHLHIGAE